MFSRLKFFLLFILTITITTVSTSYAFDAGAHLQARIVSDQETLHPNKPFNIGVAFDIQPGWHIYWDNAGDSGYKTTIDWTFDKDVNILEENVTSTPEVFNSQDIVDYGFKGNVLYVTKAKFENEPTPFSLFVEAHVKYLICKDVCIPGETKISKALNVGLDNEPSLDAGMFLIHQDRLPLHNKDISITSILEGSKYHILINEFQDTINNIRFIPQHEGLIVDSAKQILSVSGTTQILTIEKDTLSKKEFKTVDGILNINNNHFTKVATTPEIRKEIAIQLPIEISETDQSLVETSQTIKLPREVSQTEVKTYSIEEIQTNRTLQLTLLFAFLGGLILNLMPCVLPVLSLKALSLLHHANHKISWWYGLVYTAGIMTTFAILAYVMIMLKTSGQEIGWGFQLQSPMFVASLALIVMLVGLQLSNVFHFGASFGRLQNLVSGHGTISTFFSGMLITVVATPCTAPFMGTAIAFALTQPNEIIYVIFGALGLGLAFPYLAMTFMPFLLRLLPKPGAWELTFQNFLAFPMYATVLWLIWVYGQQTSFNDMYKLLIALFVISFGAWIFGRSNVLSASFKKKLFGFVILILSVLYFYYSVGSFNKLIEKHLPSYNTHIEWEKWSLSEVEKGLLQGRPVFVNFTADWCITCKVNERMTFSSANAAKFVEENGILMLKADWTMKDDVIGRELQKHGRFGVPLYLMYSPENPMEPKMLKQIITLTDFKESLK